MKTHGNDIYQFSYSGLAHQIYEDRELFLQRIRDLGNVASSYKIPPFTERMVAWRNASVQYNRRINVNQYDTNKNKKQSE